MGAVFCLRNWGGHFLTFTSQKKQGSVVNILYEGYVWWKSIFVRKDFQIFCSQCHSRTRSAVYADNANP